MVCPICEKEILEGDSKYLLGNDRPHFSVYLHKVCFLQNLESMQNNLTEWLPILTKVSEKVSKRARKS